MDTVVLERETTSAPAKRRLRFGPKQLALAGLVLAIILGGILGGVFTPTEAASVAAGGEHQDRHVLHTATQHGSSHDPQSARQVAELSR